MWGRPDKVEKKVSKTKTRHIWTYYGYRDSRKIISREAKFDSG